MVALSARQAVVQLNRRVVSAQRKPVVAGLSGGLGNQLFQYAAGRCLAERLNTNLVLDLSWFNGQKSRRFALAPFKIKAELHSLYSWLPQRGQALASRISRRCLSHIMGVPVFREQHFHYSTRFEALSDSVYLEGYWQSERYFQEIRPFLLNELALRGVLPAACADLIQKIKDCDAICVHVRRGDYLSNLEASKVHGTCSIDYYQAAVGELLQMLHQPHCFVFSDDPLWAKESLFFDCPVTVVDINHADDAHLDLILMTACRNFVIANSSLSWWGAWLGNASQKKVIAPAKWFLTESNDTRDLLPISWRRF